MDEEKKLNGRKNMVFSIISIVILCILLFPLYWALITSLKTEQEIFQSADVLSAYSESEILCGAGGDRGL